MEVIQLDHYLRGSSEDQQRIVAQVMKSLQSVGFLQLSVPLSLLSPPSSSSNPLHTLFQHAKDFFHSATEAKERARSVDRAKRGYSNYLDENFASLSGVKAANDAVEKLRIGPPNASFEKLLEGLEGKALKEARKHYCNNAWTSCISPALRADLESVYSAMDGIARVLLDVLDRGLGGSSLLQRSVSDSPTSIMTVNFYPALDREEKGRERRDASREEVRMAAHTDVSMLTLLFLPSNSFGLQILPHHSNQNKNKNTGELADGWIDVLALCSSNNAEEEEDENLLLIVNVGDCLQHWTHGVLTSTPHRVVAASSDWEERLSLAFFLSPRYDTLLSDLTGAKEEGEDELNKEVLTYSRWRELRIKEAMSHLNRPIGS